MLDLGVEGTPLRCFLDYLGDIKGCLSCWDVSEGPVHVGFSLTRATPPFWHISKMQYFFHLTLLRHQNIKNSLSAISKNDRVLPFFLFSVSVKEKLQFTVSLDHEFIRRLLLKVISCKFLLRWIFWLLC